MTSLEGLGWRLLAVWALVACLAPATRASEATLVPSRDNTLFEDPTGALSDGAGPTLFAGNNGQDLARRALLLFDVAGALPAGALIINVSNVSNTTARTFSLHRVVADWGEGTSSTSGGSGAPATAGDATWLHTRWPDQLWDTPGGDFAATPSAALVISGVALYACAAPAMASDVQAWLDDPAGNHGWLMMGDEVTLNTAKRLDSRENPTASQRPMLIVYYNGVVGVASEQGSREAMLGRCYPNPAKTTTRLRLSLARRERVRVEVWDLVGRRVATLLDGPCESGTTQLEWSGRDARGARVPAGLYLCRLVVEGRRVAGTRVTVLP
jgi:hypothetical protein